MNTHDFLLILETYIFNFLFQERSGAICCMKLAADYFNITDDILLIAG